MFLVKLGALQLHEKGENLHQNITPFTFCIKPSQTVAVPGHPGNMTSGFNFRNRPFERNPTTWVPTAPMRNGKNSHSLKGMDKRDSLEKVAVFCTHVTKSIVNTES